LFLERVVMPAISRKNQKARIRSDTTGRSEKKGITRKLLTNNNMSMLVSPLSLSQK
jgi:hypothetical protein